MHTSNDASQPAPSRRTLTKGLAWSVPALAVASATPSFASSVLFAGGMQGGQYQQSGTTGCTPNCLRRYEVLTAQAASAGTVALPQTPSCLNTFSITGLVATDIVNTVDWYFTARDCGASGCPAPIVWTQVGCSGSAFTWSVPTPTSDLNGTSFSGSTVSGSCWSYNDGVNGLKTSTVYKSTLTLNLAASSLISCGSGRYALPTACSWKVNYAGTTCGSGGATGFPINTSPVQYKIDVVHPTVNGHQGGYFQLGNVQVQTNSATGCTVC